MDVDMREAFRTICAEPIPCFRCSGEAHSGYTLEEEGECVTCHGRGKVTPGKPYPSDEKLVSQYVRTQIWAQLRQLRAAPRLSPKDRALLLILGKRKAREAWIKKQAKELYADFVRMGEAEQRRNRLGLAEVLRQAKESRAHSG